MESFGFICATCISRALTILLTKSCALFYLVQLRIFINDAILHCWLCMWNSLADDVVFILMNFRNARKSIQTENIQLAHLEL